MDKQKKLKCRSIVTSKSAGIDCIYRHFKGNWYRVMFIANDSETNKPRVIYTSIVGQHELVWDRYLDEFLSEIDKEKYPDEVQSYRFMNLKELEEVLSEEEYKKIYIEYIRLIFPD